jgi:hypothetical protein
MSNGDPARLIEPGASLAPAARLRNTVCWRGAVIEDDVELDACIVCSGAVVRRGSRYHRSVLQPAEAAPAVPDAHPDGLLTVTPIDR